MSQQTFFLLVLLAGDIQLKPEPGLVNTPAKKSDQLPTFTDWIELIAVDTSAKTLLAVLTQLDSLIVVSLPGSEMYTHRFSS